MEKESPQGVQRVSIKRSVDISQTDFLAINLALYSLSPGDVDSWRSACSISLGMCLLIKPSGCQHFSNFFRRSSRVYTYSFPFTLQITSIRASCLHVGSWHDSPKAHRRLFLSIWWCVWFSDPLGPILHGYPWSDDQCLICKDLSNPWISQFSLNTWGSTLFSLLFLLLLVLPYCSLFLDRPRRRPMITIDRRRTKIHGMKASLTLSSPHSK